MVDLSDFMFQEDGDKFVSKLETCFKHLKMHFTSKEALQCFLVGLIINIFQSPIAQRNNLKNGFLASSHIDYVYFLATTETSDYKFVIFDLTNSIEQKNPVLSSELRDKLVSMLDGKFLLPDEKLPEARVVKIQQSKTGYKVICSMKHASSCFRFIV